ncbi:MAG: YIP1 family protein [Gammaproteobacteria bacterium]|nr:YIP1 family protein [Gammaproteobacteria bacterium]
MVIQHIWGLLTHPKTEWTTIRDEHDQKGSGAMHVLVLAAIPVICGFIGTTQVGWRIGPGEPIRVTQESALMISAAYYVALLAGVYSVGYMIHWMADTYDAKQPFSRSLVLASYIPTPLFLIGFMQLYPVMWLNLLVGLPALAYTVALLYTGVPIMMGISQDRGFLFSSAVLAVGLVLLVAMLAATVVLWGFGFEPDFTTKLAMLAGVY